MSSSRFVLNLCSCRCVGVFIASLGYISVVYDFLCLRVSDAAMMSCCILEMKNKWQNQLVALPFILMHDTRGFSSLLLYLPFFLLPLFVIITSSTALILVAVLAVWIAVCSSLYSFPVRTSSAKSPSLCVSPNVSTIS